MNKIAISTIVALICLCLQVQAQTDKPEFLSTDDGTRLFVKKSGNGPVCIFVHGGPGAWSKSFEDLKGNRLETSLAMVYYDQRGCGRSDSAATGDYSLQTMISDIDLIRKHYGADKVYLIAHSFGGILAANYALKFPDHVKGLILLNSTLNMRHSLTGQINYVNSLLKTTFTPADSSFSALTSAFSAARKALADKGLGYKMLSDNKQTVALVEKIDAENPGDYAFAHKVFDINAYWEDYTQITPKITLPVLVITGQKDHSVGEDHYQLFRFPDQEVRKMSAGHIDYYENNEAFTSSVFDFVRRTNK